MSSHLTKTDACAFCSYPLTCPKKQSICRCPKCRKMNVFLCHIIQTSENFIDINCLKCPNKFLLINCPECTSFQAFQKDQLSSLNGIKYQCKCGLLGTLIQCVGCNTLITIKGKNSHQLYNIKCKKCEFEFKYKICEECRKVVYKSVSDMSQNYICSTSTCPKSNTNNPYELNTHANDYYKNRFSQFQQPQGYLDKQRVKIVGDPSKKQRISLQNREVCKICLTNESNMINTKCYHLAVCQSCCSKLGRHCPICRSQGGTYHKIYKS